MSFSPGGGRRSEPSSVLEAWWPLGGRTSWCATLLTSNSLSAVMQPSLLTPTGAATDESVSV